jgi:hypothetical protein
MGDKFQHSFTQELFNICLLQTFLVFVLRIGRSFNQFCRPLLFFNPQWITNAMGPVAMEIPRAFDGSWPDTTTSRGHTSSRL